jgi:hypothetical protein
MCFFFVTNVNVGLNINTLGREECMVLVTNVNVGGTWLLTLCSKRLNNCRSINVRSLSTGAFHE